jgi:hypothetical protein
MDSNPSIELEIKRLEYKVFMIAESYRPYNIMRQTIVNTYDMQGLGKTRISDTANAPSTYIKILYTLAAVSLSFSEVVLFPILYSMAPTTGSVVEYFGIL